MKKLLKIFKNLFKLIYQIKNKDKNFLNKKLKENKIIFINVLHKIHQV